VEVVVPSVGKFGGGPAVLDDTHTSTGDNFSHSSDPAAQLCPGLLQFSDLPRRHSKEDLVVFATVQGKVGGRAENSAERRRPWDPFRVQHRTDAARLADVPEVLRYAIAYIDRSRSNSGGNDELPFTEPWFRTSKTIQQVARPARP
jgi:hypothetical protein